MGLQREMKMAEAKINKNTIPILNGWDNMPADIPDWIKSLRVSAAESLMNTGLPTPAWEDWKYTNLRALENMKFSAPQSLQTVSDVKSPFFALNPIVIQLFNGKVVGDIPIFPDGLEVSKLEDVWMENWFKETFEALPGNFANAPMEALNTAFLNDGVVIRVKENKQVDMPLLLLSVNDNSKDTLVTMPRVLVVLEKDAELNMIEHHKGEGSYIINQATNITISENAKLGHYMWQDNDKVSGHFFNTTRIKCYDNSVYDSAVFNSGAKLSRHEIFADLLGESIECILGGAYNLTGEQHHDTTIKAGHFLPNSISKQIYKGVINDKARAVFQGRICVHNDAQGTDGHQLNRTLLLSEEAEFNAKPELEIYADDVKCSHGVTSGDLNNDELFYLRSRGIPEKEAKEILVQGFLAEAIDSIAHTAIRDIFLNIAIER